MIRDDQVHRLLEDLESVALAARLLNQVVDNFKRDIEGMMNGINKNHK